MKTLILLALTIFQAAAFAGNTGCPLVDPPGAKLTIHEFADFQCPYCAGGALTMKQIEKNYPDQVRVVFHNFPLSFHAQAANAAKAFAAVCLQNPAAADAFQEALFVHQDQLGEAYIEQTAAQLGLNVQKLKTDMAGPEVAKMIADDQALAAAHGFKGTPAFVIGKKNLMGSRPYADFKKVIDQELAAP